MTYKGKQVIGLILIAEISGDNGIRKTLFKKVYLGQDGQIGENASTPDHRQLPILIDFQHQLLERAGFVVVEETERAPTDNADRWSLERHYRQSTY